MRSEAALSGGGGGIVRQPAAVEMIAPNLRAVVPEPIPGERPTGYADRVGRWHALQVSEDRRKQFAQFMTPKAIADFMAGYLTPRDGVVRVLDPGAGTGVLTCATSERLAAARKHPAEIVVEAYEVDPLLIAATRKTFAHLCSWLAGRGIAFRYRIRPQDFIGRFAGVLTRMPELFGGHALETHFDIAVSNPPYFKLPKSDPRVRIADAVVHGQPNIYALFMAVSALALAPGGEFVFITPRSFTSGPYFRRFREMFFSTVQIEAIHVFESRREAFKRDGVLQETVIVKAKRNRKDGSRRSGSFVRISSSNGDKDLAGVKVRKVPLESLVDMATREKMLRVPAGQEQDRIIKAVDSWPGSLKKYGLEISTGPVVPFRATEYLSVTGGDEFHAPLLWMQNVKPMRIEWPVQMRKPQHIRVCGGSRALLLPDGNYLLLRRFSAKEQQRRLTAAPLDAGALGAKKVGLENHLNYVHRPCGSLTPEEVWGLAVLYNSSFMDAYFRVLNGSTQVSATEIRAIPLPPLEVISQIGRKAMVHESPSMAVEELAAEVFEDARQKAR